MFCVGLQFLFVFSQRRSPYFQVASVPVAVLVERLCAVCKCPDMVGMKKARDRRDEARLTSQYGVVREW